MKDLLNVLYDHYNAQLPLGTVMPYGWTIGEVNYAAEVNDEGELTGIYALGATSDTDEVEDKTKAKAKDKATPHQMFTIPVRHTRTSGAYPYLFCDAAHYMFGTPKSDDKHSSGTWLQRHQGQQDNHKRHLQQVQINTQPWQTTFLRDSDATTRNVSYNGSVAIQRKPSAWLKY